VYFGGNHRAGSAVGGGARRRGAGRVGVKKMWAVVMPKSGLIRKLAVNIFAC
jgi:hypothetical protein